MRDEWDNFDETRVGVILNDDGTYSMGMEIHYNDERGWRKMRGKDTFPKPEEAEQHIKTMVLPALVLLQEMRGSTLVSAREIKLQPATVH